MFDVANNFTYPGKKVPIDDDGGHWLKSAIGDEIMAKGWTYPFKQPISEMTVGAFLDLGYDVSCYNSLIIIFRGRWLLIFPKISRPMLCAVL